jgi:hypothetical protein
MQALSTEAWSAIHALTPQDRIVMDQMRALVEPGKGKLRGVAARAWRRDPACAWRVVQLGLS